MTSFGPSDEQRALRDSARSVLEAHSPLALTRAAYDEPDIWRQLWKTIVDLGWTGVITGEADPDELLTAVMVVEESGRVATCAPVASTLIAAGALSVCRVAAAVDFDLIGSGSVATFAGVDGLAQVRDAARAELLVVLCRDVDASTLRVYRRDSFAAEAGDSVDPSQPVGAVRLDGEPDLTFQVDEADVLRIVRVLAAAELVGVADRAVAMGVEHARTRQQFGQPIGAFQGVKHRLADAYVAVERARSLTYAAASQGGVRAAMLAKAAAGDAALVAVRACVSVHGAIAQTWEHDAHLLLRRAWLGAAMLGDSGSLYAEAAREYLAAAPPAAAVPA